MDGFISYEGLPINSGGAHSLGKKRYDKVYAECLHFLQTFTNYDLADYIHLTFHGSKDRAYRSLPFVWKLTRRFGLPSLGSWPYVTGNRRTYSWNLRSVEDVEDALKWLERSESFPLNDPSPLVMGLMCRFYFIDPVTREVLPGQDMIPQIDHRLQNSQLYIRLGQKSSISAWFAFPFEEWGEPAKGYIGSVTRGLPFKCSENHWRVWRYTKNGKWIPNVLDINT